MTSRGRFAAANASATGWRTSLPAGDAARFSYSAEIQGIPDPCIHGQREINGPCRCHNSRRIGSEKCRGNASVQPVDNSTSPTVMPADTGFCS